VGDLKVSLYLQQKMLTVFLMGHVFHHGGEYIKEVNEFAEMLLEFHVPQR
jgi:hypothetical protein